MTLNQFLTEWRNTEQTVGVKTSGSTGAPKEMRVEKERMRASARMTCDFLGLREGDSALLCMPVDYIAGKMMVVRAEERGLRLTAVEPSLRPFDNLKESFDFVAMVPAQVFESIDNPLFRQTRHLIIGGGAVSAELEAKLSSFPGCAWSTYGMTETLSHIAMRRINGPSASPFYTPLPGVSVSLSSENCLKICAPHLSAVELTTNDIAEIRGQRFRIVGRKDNIICSGGLKIQAEEVEALLSPHIASPFLITKRTDPKFGEAVILLTESHQLKEIETLCQQLLPRYWRPKAILHVAALPMTETGKPARAQAAQIAEALR